MNWWYKKSVKFILQTLVWFKQNLISFCVCIHVLASTLSNSNLKMNNLCARCEIQCDKIMAKTFFNYKLQKVSLSECSPVNASNFKQFELTNCSFKREKWLAQRLIFLVVLFSFIFKVFDSKYAFVFVVISSIVFYAQLYFTVKKGTF